MFSLVKKSINGERMSKHTKQNGRRGKVDRKGREETKQRKREKKQVKEAEKDKQ
jgi:hypothetical protein